MKEKEAREILRTIAKTLKYCHDMNVAHRDLKAENVLIGKGGKLKLIDFAFASRTDKDQKVDSYCGTPSYMAPEIFSKLPHCPKKADVWAFGVLAYRLIAGELPYVRRQLLTQAQNKQDKLETKIRDEDFPREKLQKSSESLIFLLEKCLKKEPKKRPSMSKILEDMWLNQKD